MKFNLFKIKKEKLKVWQSWTNLLRTEYKKEALISLVEEGVTYEAFVIFKIGDEHYTIGLSEGAHFETNMSREINKKHNAIKKEALERIGPVDIAYELHL